MGGLALTATSLVGPVRRASAQTSLAIGDHEITVFSDGHLTLPMNFALPEQSADEIAEVLTPHGLATNALMPDCNVTLLRTGDRLALFDVGSGSNFQSTAGELLSRLEEAGIDPADITDVVLTHGHPDHLWGMLDEFDDPLYPQAVVWVPQAEWDYWRADDTLAGTPDERKKLCGGRAGPFLRRLKSRSP
ncbi:MBL fold metallo-hydrolase [Roseibium salinum]|nr:MBL fold metallo-hydrolase [Roseibium salinum]